MTTQTAPSNNGGNSAVAVFETHEAAEAAVRHLQGAGVDMHTLSIVGQGYEKEEKVVGYYNTGDRMKAWGRRGAFWGGIWGWLFGAAFFVIPGLGQIAVAGPLVASLVGALRGAAIVGGVSALGGALTGIGIPKDSVIRYEAAIRADRLLVIAQGTEAEVTRARKFLRKYLRKTHRWLAPPFAALIVVVLLTHDAPLGVGIQQAQQVILLIMALTGLYLFLLPWWTKWKRARGGVQESRTR